MTSKFHAAPADGEGPSQSAEPLRDISDTAFWVAHYRAKETARPDAHFRDPFAARLAGERGPRVAELLKRGRQDGWPLVTRTVAMDAMIAEAVTRDGVDTILCLAAGLDARPYRLPLPRSLRWIEVDLPAILAYKADRLADAQPQCTLETVPLDLLDRGARGQLFRRVAGESRRVLVLSEGLLVYLTESAVGELAEDLHGAGNSFASWIFDLHSPQVLQRLQQQWGRALSRANAPMSFGPAESTRFFARFGWAEAELRGLVSMTRTLRRGPLLLRLMSAVIPRISREAKDKWDRSFAAVRLARV